MDLIVIERTMYIYRGNYLSTIQFVFALKQVKLIVLPKAKIVLLHEVFEKSCTFNMPFAKH
jgi:hypothetical protein